MARFIHVGFNPVGQPKTKELEPWFAQLGDWIRYSATAWVVWTDYTPEQIYNYLKPQLHPNDQVLIFPADMSVHQGWMPQWVWNWITGKQTYTPLGLSGTVPMTGLSGLGGYPPNPLNPYSNPLGIPPPPKRR